MELPGFRGPGGARRVSVPWTSSDVLKASAAVVAAFFLTVAAIAVAVNAAGESDDWFDEGEVIGLPAPLAVAALLEALFLLAVYAFARTRDRRSIRRLGFVAPEGRFPYLLAVAAWFAGILVSGVWILVTSELGIEALEPPDSATEVLDYTGGELVLPILVVGLFGPFCEEVFFRGFAMPAFAQRYGVWGGIALSALLFSVFHFNIGLLVPVFIFGIVLGWLYARTGSIFPSMAAHAVQNVIALLAVN